MVQKRKSIFKVGYIVVLLMVSVVVFVWYSYVLRNELRGLVRDTLKEVSNQNILVVQKEIEGDLSALVEISERVAAMGETEPEEVLGILSGIEERYSFNRMGFCREDGIAHTTNGDVVDISGREYFIHSMEGESYVSNPIIDAINGEEVIVFSAPVRNGDSVIGILCATYQVESLREMLAVSSFEGEGYTYIVERDGDKVVDSTHPTSFQNMTNIFTSMKDADKRNYQVVTELQKLLDSGGPGYVIEALFGYR